MKARPGADAAVDLLRVGFREECGLWRIEQAGHTRPVATLKAVHSGVLTAARLTMAAQLGMLAELPTERILRALHGLQWRDGSEKHGCFRWYAEEPEPVDTNAAFFTGLNLIVLAARDREALPGAAGETLDQMLAGLWVWFRKECDTEAAFYPNKFLGDLVCAWLLAEQLHPNTEPEGELAAILHRAADYWLEQHWGWGEHMSEVYSAVMLNELSALLLLARRLPSPLRDKYRRLFEELVGIEDAYGGGPRVPAIRTYAFGGRPSTQPFRASIFSWEGRADLPTSAIEFFPFGHLFHELGWEELAGPVGPRSRHVKIPCFGGVTATAHNTDSWRIGTLSRFPLMPNADHAQWGLSWQTMPVVFAAGDSGWGFLRWNAREDGVDRFHPARDKRAAYLNNALTDVVAPPITGRTHCLQDGADAIIVRRMPALSRRWETLADQLVLAGDFVVESEEARPGVCRLLLRAEGIPFTIFFFPLGSQATPRLRHEDGQTIWEARWTAEDLRERESVTCAWMICAGREAPEAEAPSPVRHHGSRIHSPGDEGWTFSWPGRPRVVVDPGAGEPLRQIEDGVTL